MYIGEKKIKETRETEERTPGGTLILEVEYKNGTVERFSKIMYDQIVTKEPIDATALRDRRLQYLVSATLVLLREYGIKIGETPHYAILLNQSINNNVDEATRMLWAKWMPKPLSQDDVDLVTVDRVLKSEKKTLKDVLPDPGNAGVA